MIIYKIREDNVYDGEVTVPDSPIAPKGYSLTAPPEIPDGYHAVMKNGWKLIAGPKPVYPRPVPPPSIASVKEKYKQQIAEKRWEVETGGMVLMGIPLNTDPISQTKYIGAHLSASQNPNYTVKWKTANGFMNLDANTIILIADSVRTFVQNCFNHESDLVTAVDSANTISELSTVDIDNDWPTA